MINEIVMRPFKSQYLQNTHVLFFREERYRSIWENHQRKWWFSSHCFVFFQGGFSLRAFGEWSGGLSETEVSSDMWPKESFMCILNVQEAQALVGSLSIKFLLSNSQLLWWWKTVLGKWQHLSCCFDNHLFHFQRPYVSSLLQDALPRPPVLPRVAIWAMQRLYASDGLSDTMVPPSASGAVTLLLHHGVFAS